MFDFVPVQYYQFYFHLSVLALILVAVWQCHKGIILRKDVVDRNANLSWIIALVLFLYMGFRPINAAFGDTVNYAHTFFDLQKAKGPIVWSLHGEWLYKNMMAVCAKYASLRTFFLLCACLYIFPLWLALQRIFKSYNYLPFLVCLSMFSFWSYGVNGIRNGMGASLFILAITYINSPWKALLIALIAAGCHSSIYLMIGAGMLAWFYKNSYHYLLLWCLCILVSYVKGSSIQAYLSGLSFMGGDDRMAGYLTGNNMIGEVVQMSMAFRWDFLLYSSMAVAVGYYFIFVRHFKDEYYHWVFNIYLITNAFWILVIRAAYSNRFAQISWFIMPLVLIYPFMKQRIGPRHEKMLGYALLAFYAYSFYENIL